MGTALYRLLQNKRKSREYIFAGLGTEAAQTGKMIFCTGMGRSGTHFLASLLNLDKKVNAYHLDEIGNPVADSFYQYTKWFGLDVDQEPLFASRAFLASKALSEGNVYFESNPYLNLHVSDLAKKFQCKILIIYRHPLKVVESHYNKGWYKDYDPNYDASGYKAPGYQYAVEQPHHFFGRFFPVHQDEFTLWNAYSRVGKISWMWQQVYRRILDDISSLQNVGIVRTEQINYETYGLICDFLEIDRSNSLDFEVVLKSKPGKAIYTNKPVWSDREKDEFKALTTEVFGLLENHPLRLKS